MARATDPHAVFRRSYAEARDQFLELAALTGAAQHHYAHPLTGPGGEPLALDLARWGAAEAGTVVAITSGTHGVEGFAGSAVQALLLRDGLHQQLPDDVALIMVHAVNPFGFAWQRRVNEDNVDLNRNFIDHDGVHPDNVGYAALADLIAVRDWTPESIRELQSGLFQYAAEQGAPAVQAALSGGQYQFPDGVFYGGLRPTWSNERMHQVARDWLRVASRVFVIDVHTGLGEYAKAECIVEYAAASEAERLARQIWGERTKNALAGESESAAVSGSMISGMARAVPGRLIGAGLEYGTVPVAQVMQALLADRWLHCHGDLDSEQGRQIKAQMRAAFYPDADDWRESVAAIAREVTAQLMDFVAR